jgi:hypothetical protein
MTRKIDAKLLERRWLHSHEEDSERAVVYRPAGWAFPPSRGRSGFDLRPGGRLVTLGPGPTDRPEERPGRWRLDGDLLVLEPGPGRGPARTLRVERAAADRLEIRR